MVVLAGCRSGRWIWWLIGGNSGGFGGRFTEQKPFDLIVLQDDVETQTDWVSSVLTTSFGFIFFEGTPFPVEKPKKNPSESNDEPRHCSCSRRRTSSFGKGSKGGKAEPGGTSSRFEKLWSLMFCFVYVFASIDRIYG